ncbi:hypothetical protein Q4Q52_05755 [Shewanella sp. SP1S2-4]|uniref:hypothetical protein n=1 Tax=Shewanella sp. SP1S2-4 TaxID=3063537 RepID=UPI002891BC92|nr:hypothetical protein [Shewanella sp. SP1S2-4]MDT3319272.1 hypothetical protein [Shewanella sp. SP1S2-4]
MTNALRRVSVFFTHHWLKVVSLVIVVALMGYSFWLLKKMFITSSDFVTWNMAVWFFALIINLLPSISELSLGGYVLKLREATKNAQQTLEQMRPFMLNIYKQMLLSMKIAVQKPFAFAGELDDRIEPFWSLVSAIRTDGLEIELNEEIKTTATKIALDQLKNLFTAHHVVLREIDYKELVDLSGSDKYECLMSLEPFIEYHRLYKFIKN